MITGLSDVYVNVQDMKRAVAFYRDVLGLRVVDSNDWWTSLDVGGVRVGLHWTEGGAVPPVPRDSHGAHAGAVITFRTDDVRAELARLKQAGVKFLSEVEAMPWGTLATFEDPDGNVLKLMERK